jgi:hypothetical protein
LTTVIADRIGKVGGVLRTRTFLAFHSSPQRDLTAAFALSSLSG